MGCCNLLIVDSNLGHQDSHAHPARKSSSVLWRDQARKVET